MTTPPPAEAPESADRTPFTIDDADAFTAKVLELHERMSRLRADELAAHRQAKLLLTAADDLRREWRDAERELAEIVGLRGLLL